MTTHTAPLTECRAWKALAAHYAKVREPALGHDSSTNSLIRRYRTVKEAL